MIQMLMSNMMLFNFFSISQENETNLIEQKRYITISILLLFKVNTRTLKNLSFI